MMRELNNNYKIALNAAIEASAEIMRIYNLPLEKEIKSDGSPVTSADIAASKIINERLKATQIPVIGEEIIQADYSERIDWNEVWIVDPLDGTKEFIKKNGEFAVNIALVIDRIPRIGIITSPVNRTVLFGGKEVGVYYFSFDQINELNEWQLLSPAKLNRPIVVATSRSHPSSIEKELIQLLQQKYSEINYIRKGSSLKFFDLALGLADIYPRFAPTMEWDIAAGQAILEALGGEVLNVVTKQPLSYNKENLYNPFFIARTKALIEDYV